MAFKVIGAYPRLNSRGEVTQTEISINQQKPYKLLVEIVDGDYTKASDETLINLALEKNFKEVYQDRALGEVVEEFDGIKSAVDHVDAKVQEVEELAQSVNENAEMINGAMVELMELLELKGFFEDEELAE